MKVLCPEFKYEHFYRQVLHGSAELTHDTV